MTLLKLLLEQSPFDEAELRSIVSTAPRRYKTYQIAKRNARGSRTIAQPAPEVKLLQSLVVEHVIAKWPVHVAATAYRHGASIGAHAIKHVNSRFLLKLDFKDFFPSISATDIKTHARQHGQQDKGDLELLARLLTWRPRDSTRFCLSIGAPSSPSCSNSVLFDFDSLVFDYCKATGVLYSRYADDMAFSTDKPDILLEVVRYVESVLASLKYPRLQLNQGKTTNVSKKYRRSLVGLVLTPDGRISLGREKKRQVRAAVHHFTTGRLDPVEISRLRGYLAFASSVERTFVESLLKSYGESAFLGLGLPKSIAVRRD